MLLIRGQRQPESGFGQRHAVNYRVPSLWRSAEWGLNVGAGAGMSLPTSLRSRYNNLGSALRVALPVAFFKAGFSAFWNPSLGYNVYTRANPLTQRMYSEEDKSVSHCLSSSRSSR